MRGLPNYQNQIYDIEQRSHRFELNLCTQHELIKKLPVALELLFHLLRTLPEHQSIVGLSTPLKSLEDEATESLRDLQGRIRLLRQELLAFERRIEVSRLRAGESSTSSPRHQGDGPSQTPPGIAPQDGDQQAERSQLAKERKLLDEREKQIIEFEDALIARLDNLSLREVQLEQREENLAEERARFNEERKKLL